MMRTCLWTMAAALMFPAGMASASIVVGGTELPAGAVSLYDFAETLTDRGVRSGRNQAQAFAVDEPLLLDAIVLWVEDIAAGKTFTAQLWTTADRLAESIDQQMLLASFEYVTTAADATATANNTAQLLTWDLDDLLLSPSVGSEGYIIQLVDDGGALTMQWRAQSGALSYAEGNYYQTGAPEDFDLAVALVPVPEPASLALLAVGGLMVLRRR